MATKSNAPKQAVPKQAGAKPSVPGQPNGAKKFEFKMEFNARRLLIWFLILLLFVPAFARFFAGAQKNNNINVTQMYEDINAGKVSKLTD